MDPNQNQPAPPQPNYDPRAKVGNALPVTQPGERTICEVKRHPIGILGIYVATGFILVVAAVLAFIVVPHFYSASGQGGKAIAYGGLVFLLVTIFSVIFAFISSKVYWGNSWIVTTDSLTQIEQDSLFDRQSSQLSLGNIEDVTAEQNGVLPHMLNYGWIRVETAGERSKFVFQYCPNPNYYAQQILSARESFEQNRGGENLQRVYRGQGSYAPPSQPSQPPQDQPSQMQAGDPGYGAYPAPNGVGQVDYPDESSDQGVNVNT